jgi:CIC family chloride channel protein
LLIMGGAMGTALAGYMPDGTPGFWALLAMAATMGGTMRSPLTATFFAVELTGNTHVLLPLIAACGTAHAVTILLMKRSILTEKVARRGHHVVREYRVDPFALGRVSEVMTGDVETVPATMTLHGAAAFLASPSTAHPSFPVVDEDGRVLGVIDPPAVLRLSTANIAHLPVISPEDGRLVGYIGWKDLMRVRAKLHAEETTRTTFYPIAEPFRRLSSRRDASKVKA